MTKPRTAIYNALDFSPAQRKKFERELRTNLPELRAAYNVTNPNDDQARTEILQKYKEGQDGLGKRPSAVHADRFQQIFHVSISQFWHPVLGFDVLKFDEQVVKSGKEESCAQAVQRQFDYEAVAVIKALLTPA